MGAVNHKRREACRRLFGQGLSAREVGERIGITVGNALAYKKRLGLCRNMGPKPAAWSADEVRRLTGFEGQTMSWDELAAHFPGRSVVGLKVKAKRLGLGRSFHTGGPEAMKPKRLWYQRLADYYKDHTRQETQAWAAERGLSPILLKHFFWRIWPKLRAKRKFDGAAIRYDLASHLAALKILKTRNLSGSRGFGKGTILGGAAHNLGKLVSRYPGRGCYWGAPSSWFAQIVGVPHVAAYRLMKADGVTRSDSTGVKNKRYSWRRVLTFLEENRLYRDRCDELSFRVVYVMARFEEWLERITAQFPTEEDAVLYLLNRRAQYGLESAREAVRNIERTRAQRGDQPKPKLRQPKRKAPRQARGHDGPRHEAGVHARDRARRHGVRRQGHPAHEAQLRGAQVRGRERGVRQR